MILPEDQVYRSLYTDQNRRNLDRLKRMPGLELKEAIGTPTAEDAWNAGLSDEALSISRTIVD
jgi:hypothetical protein